MPVWQRLDFDSTSTAGATHRFPSIENSTVDVIFRCADLLSAALRLEAVWTRTALTTIGVPIARTLALQQFIGQLYHGSWTAKDGLEGIVLALAQTADGYLWVGTTPEFYRSNGGCLSAAACRFYSWQVQCLH